MAFSEETKLLIKKKSHFSCCLCHNRGIEIHHIISQSEGGLDTKENAAPLCPSCHEIYGANPTKRKFIREARDFWYELCSKKYFTDHSILENISKRLEQTASKSDLESVTEILTNMLKSKSAYKDLISVELPTKYWVIVLAGLEPLIKGVQSQIEEMRNTKKTMDDVEEMQEHEVTALVGTLFARGAIVDALIEAGAMKPRASKLGAKALMKKTNQFVNKKSKSKKTKRK